EQNQKEQLRQQLIKVYQARTRNEDLQKTLRTYGEISREDVSTELSRRERKNGQK
ncbi:18769_t:CDS:1, partial [Racocetra persica]